MVRIIGRSQGQSLPPLGLLDVLVNNAGISGAIADVNGPVALKVFDTNVIGLIRVTQAALDLRRRRKCGTS